MTLESPDSHATKSHFQLPWWLRSAYAKTMFPGLPWAWKSRPKLRREILELPDSDVNAVDCMVDGDLPPNAAPLLVILHGLEGSTESSYPRMLMDTALD